MTALRHIILSLRHVNWVLFTAMAGMTWALLVRISYYLKPSIPVGLRLSVGRWRARQIRRSSSDSWPILDSAGVTPDGWPGWPDKKLFALVLTHDVGTQIGVDRVKQLAEIEMKLGFRSCFNFIPEGSCQIPEALRQWLMDRGFEIGVHDNQHDRKLCYLRAHFSASAKRINLFLKKWNSVGFRSGCKLRNPGWIHELDILYDGSTSDTDPFEPYPAGADTIFPFWVPGCDGGGHVELPHTLARDSTLFVMLREQSDEIWRRKLRWIASRGGMAMVNVHPDFTVFGDTPLNQWEFPVTRYESFLVWVSQTYDGQYWPALPKDVAAFYRDRILSNTTLLASRQRMQTSGQSAQGRAPAWIKTPDRVGRQVVG